jgi:ABC-type transporter MlaC component
MKIEFNPAKCVQRCLAAVGGAVLAVTVLMGNPAQAGSCAAADVAMQAGTAFLVAAKTRRASDFAAALASYTDMNQISLFALGKYRGSLPADRTAEFVSLTSRYVANTLADFALKFKAASIEVIDCRGDQVATRLVFGGGRAAKRATWRVAGGKVVDVNVQNVWLAQLLRDNYVGILNKSGGSMAILFSNIGAAPERQVGLN